MTNRWSAILTPAEIDAYHTRIAELDPGFAAQDRAWYLSRTADQLRTSAHQMRRCNCGESYQMARSYLAMRFGKICGPY
jgi:hypothetical protein